MKKDIKQKISSIIFEFTEALKANEKITIDEFLSKYPKLAKDLKPMLEASQMLVMAGKRIREKDKPVREKYKKEIWANLQAKLEAKHLAEIKKRENQLAHKELMPIQKRLDFIILLLYVKGKWARIGEGIRGITRFIKALFILQKETDLAKLVKDYYQFVPYKLGPFEPCVYQDLHYLELAGLVQKKTYSYTYRLPADEAQDTEIDEGFKFNNLLTVYSLTDRGMQFARALARWCDKKDRTILEKMRMIKTYYCQAPLKQLLKYIYQKYPEYTIESEVLEKILK